MYEFKENRIPVNAGLVKAFHPGGIQPPTKRHERQEKRMHTLLYIEDNPASLQLVQMIMAAHPNINLLTAVNGIEGIYTARLHQPDVILTDINMPCIDGFEVLSLLRADPVTARIPVVAISANSLDSDIEKGLKAGFFSYLTKPVRVNELLEGLMDAFDFSRKLVMASSQV